MVSVALKALKALLASKARLAQMALVAQLVVMALAVCPVSPVLLALLVCLELLATRDLVVSVAHLGLRVQRVRRASVVLVVTKVSWASKEAKDKSA